VIVNEATTIMESPLEDDQEARVTPDAVLIAKLYRF
jgi:hypothetical protein